MGKKIAVIGFGAAAIGYIDELKESSHNIHIFEMSKDVISSSLSGIRSDGKMFVSKEMGGNLDIPLELQKQVVDYYIEKSELSTEEVEHGDCFTNKNSDLYRKFYINGFVPVSSEFFHIGTDVLKTVMKNIYDDFKKRENIQFRFNSIITNVKELDDGRVEVYYKKPTAYDEPETVEIFDKAVVGVGRSGYKLIEKIRENHKKLAISSTNVDLGVRFELPDHIVQEINDEMYEFKVKLRSSTGYDVRTFCNNPSGFVTQEKYGRDEFFTVNGHSKAHHKSENTNFAILVTHSFTEPFNDPVGYGSYIAKLSNIIAGGNKVILQKYEDFKNSKRTKKLGRVKPTLDEENFILGDLNLVFPGKTKTSIIDFMEKLNNVIPGITCPDNLLYGVEVKFYSNILDNKYFKNIKFIGDCSGWSRSITYATCHGIMEAAEDKE